jgi:hypothetical protein
VPFGGASGVGVERGVCGCDRIGAAVTMRVEDVYVQNRAIVRQAFARLSACSRLPDSVMLLESPQASSHELFGGVRRTERGYVRC